MTQSLSNLMNAPLLVVAMLLWLLLAFLLFRELKRRAAQKKSELILQKNHPAIPERKYHLSEFAHEANDESKAPLRRRLAKLSADRQAERLESLKNVWDV
jgi:flagellar biosynthesis/type III secretory pathway M-ring protein FliF/YscJ